MFQVHMHSMIPMLITQKTYTKTYPKNIPNDIRKGSGIIKYTKLAIENVWHTKPKYQEMYKTQRHLKQQMHLEMYKNIPREPKQTP